MELLIPGLILVALMVWASTRIKKNAAAAFEAETIETENFVVEKPEGFLHVLNDASGLLFRSYSREFGTVGKKEVRRATIEIEVHRGEELDHVRKAIAEAAESIESERPYIDAGEKAVVMRSIQVKDGGEYVVLTKLVLRGGDVFEARASILSEPDGDELRKLEEAIDRLAIK